jgi:hypothetical protein
MTQTPTQQIRGPFEVKLEAQPLADANADASLGRRTINKQFHGALEAVSRGEMLSAGGTVQGSAGYVAIERVTGTLAGRKGSFVLQHHATMDRGTPMLTIVVVPDSGTDELSGLRGTMNIVIEPGGKHFYEFAYTLSA